MVEPELAYMPWGKKEEIKINCSIYFIMSRSYDLEKKQWLSLSSNKFIKDITQINFYYTSVQCEYVIKDSFGNVIQLNKKRMNSYCYLSNTNCGKYYLKVLKSNYAEINNEWIEFTLSKEDNNKSIYIELTPQNFLFKTEVILLQNVENYFFTDYINRLEYMDDDIYKGEDSTIIGHAYGAKEIRFYDKNNQLIVSMNTKNSGFHCSLEIGDDDRNNSVAAFVAMPAQDAIKTSLSYKLYCKSKNDWYNNPDNFSVSVSFTKYAPTKTANGYLHDKCLPTTLRWYGGGLGVYNNHNMLNTHSNATLEIYKNSKNRYIYSPLEVEECCLKEGDRIFDYTDEGNYYALNALYSPDRYYDLDNIYSTYNLFNWLKNYNDRCDSYFNTKTIDNIHYFDGLWIVKIIQEEAHFHDPSDHSVKEKYFKTRYYYFGTKEKAIAYAEETVNLINSTKNDWITYAGKYELEYIESELKFPFELEKLDIFKHKDTLQNIYPQFYINGEVTYIDNNTKISDENDKNNGIYLNYSAIHLFSYLQIADDYDLY